MNQNDILELEMKGCFDFFWKEANTNPNSPGYGLIRDGNAEDGKDRASIASVGFGLSGIIIGIEKGWITKAEGEERALGTLKTFWNNAEHLNGFYYHFLDMETAKKFEAFYDCASIIDTSLFMNGAITVAEYFGGDVYTYMDKIYKRIDWTKYYDESRNLYYMGYTEENGGFGQWDMYAEQLMQYILGVASPTHPVPADIYKGFKRELRTYKTFEFYATEHNPMFVHQYSHAWYDFKDVVDEDGINWFDNSVVASRAQKQYAVDHSETYSSYGENAWGFTACDGPTGYHAHGAPAFGPDNSPLKNDDGTIAPTAALSSIVFTPKDSLNVMEHLYTNIPELWSEYGFLDSYNAEKEQLWVAERVIGIDKGATLLMFENYQSGLIWNLYMKNKYVIAATEKLKWKKIK